MQKCVKGQEESAVRDWKAQHPSGREEAFFFTYDRLKRFEGDWHLLKLPLFPGLIFLECEQEIPKKKSRLMQGLLFGNLLFTFQKNEPRK